MPEGASYRHDTCNTFFLLSLSILKIPNIKTMKSPWTLPQPPIVTPEDKRYPEYVKQLQTQGFCDPELWNLDQSLSEFLYPRLLRFKEINHGYPDGLTPEEWDKILDTILSSLHWNINQFDDPEDTPAPPTYQEGFELLGKWFTHLWD
jgi:hypothetical protein